MWHVGGRREMLKGVVGKPEEKDYKEDLVVDVR